VGASVPAHPNRIMFTGREYDKETGLYYYRARYYNPQIGRFLQTDPIGYGDGMNVYRYCGNNSVNRADPTGLFSYGFVNMNDPDHGTAGALTFAKVVDGQVVQTKTFDSMDAWEKWAAENPYFFEDGPTEDLPEVAKRDGYKLAEANMDIFWALQALLYVGFDWRSLEAAGVEQVHISTARLRGDEPGFAADQYDSRTHTLRWVRGGQERADRENGRIFTATLLPWLTSWRTRWMM